MGRTNFPHGISSAGIPITGGADNYGAGGGSVYFLDAANGNDGNDGKTAQSAFKTWDVAYDALTTLKHDILYIIGGNTSVSITGATTFSKSLCHIVGVGGTKHYSNRARFAGTSACTASPMFNITGSNNTFDNVMWQFGVASTSSLVCLAITAGQRNTFVNCHIQGVTNATQSATGAADLTLDNAQENEFYNCTIGSNQAVRDNDATNVIFDTGSSMNNFYDCEFIAGVAASATGYCMFTVADNSGIAGTNIMKNCLFHHISTNKLVTLASLWSIPANMQTAYVYLINPCWATLTTALDANSRGILYCNTPAAVASAAGGKCTNL